VKRRRSLFQSNLFAQLISLIMGLSLWVVVNSSLGGQTSNGLASTTAVLHNIPITVVTSGRMIAVSMRPRKVDVSVTGSVIDVATVEAESAGIRAVAKATRFGPGVHQVPLVIENVPTSAVTYTPVTGTVATDLQEKITAFFKPQVRLEGRPLSGLIIGKAQLSSQRVRVSGPDTLVHQVSRIELPIDLSGAQTNILRKIPIEAVDGSGKIVLGLTFQPQALTVAVPVHDMQKTVGLLVSTSGHPTVGFAVSVVRVSPPSVVVSGTSELLQSVRAVLLPTIDVTGWKVGRTEQVQVPLPFAGSHVSVPQVMVTIEIVPSAVLQLSAVAVQPINARRRALYGIADHGGVVVQVAGPPATLSMLTTSDIQAYVDVSKLVFGKTASLPVQVTLPPGCIVLRVTPRNVKVTAVQHH